MYLEHCYTNYGFLIYEYTDGIKYNADTIIHKEIGPARIKYTENGNIVKLLWVINNYQDRNGKVSLIYFNNGNIKEKKICIEGDYHCEDGPAVIQYNEFSDMISCKFYLNDIEYTYDEFINTPEYYVGLKQKSINIFD